MPVVAGIGNAVMAVPLVRALARLPGARVTVAARTGAMADCFRGLAEVAEVVVLGSRPGTAWRAHRAAARGAGLYVVPFPSNRWQYSLLAAASGARRVVMHDYPVGRVRAMRVVPRALKRTTFLPAERGLHDVAQNLRLAAALAVSADVLAEVERPIFPLATAARVAAVERFGPAEGFLAIQPGCGDTVVGRAKRWPAERFAQLADALAEQGRDVVILEGPDERGLGAHVSGLSRSAPPVVELSGPLTHAAALLERAALYVGNDSGLAHVAAAVGTPAVTLFAAADPARVAPYGCAHLVVTPRPADGKPWRPRLLYPMDAAGPKLRDDGVDWPRHIELDDVLAAVARAVPETTTQRQPRRHATLG